MKSTYHKRVTKTKKTQYITIPIEAWDALQLQHKDLVQITIEKVEKQE